MIPLKMPEGLSSVAWLFTGMAIAAFLTMFAFSLPDPSPANAPEERFSAERAMKVVRKLSDDIGLRRNGTPGQQRAVEYLAAELGKLPGVEVEVQKVSGVAQYGQLGIPFPPFVYQTTNVVARLRGKSTSAILLDAHYDTFVEGVGAGDDAMGVAAVVETVRALSAGPTPAHSIVVNLNGAEEVGMLGAAGFLRHPFAKDVKAYLYADGSPRGKPVIFGTGPGNPWLLDAFSSTVPSPMVSVVPAGLADSGLLLASGDFVPLHEAGLAGIDIGALNGFDTIHTPLDVPEGIHMGTFQLLGDSLLEGTRGLLQSDLRGNVDDRGFVYYDILGLVVVTYSLATARLLAALVIALVLAALFLAIRRRILTPRQILGGLGRIALASVAALLASLIVAVIPGLILGRPHGWYSAPWLGVFAFGLPALAAAVGVLALKRKKSNSCTPLSLWGGALLFWSLGLVLTAAADVGAGYLHLWWTGFGALGFLGALLKPSLRQPLWILAFVPGAVLTLEVMATIYPFAVGHVGMIPAPAPLDPVIAALVGLTAFVLLPMALIPLVDTPRPARVALVLAVLSVMGLTAAAVHSPYSGDTPKRVQAVVAVRGNESKLLVASRDAVPLDSALEGIPGAARLESSWPPARPLDPTPSHGLPAAPPTFPPPRIDVLSSTVDSASNTRTVKIKIDAEGQSLWLFAPRKRLTAWSIGEVPQKSIDEDRMLAVFENATDEAREVTMTFSGAEPVKLELTEVRGPSNRPEVIALQQKLPHWVALDSLETWFIEKEL